MGRRAARWTPPLRGGGADGVAKEGAEGEGEVEEEEGERERKTPDARGGQRRCSP